MKFSSLSTTMFLMTFLLIDAEAGNRKLKGKNSKKSKSKSTKKQSKSTKAPPAVEGGCVLPKLMGSGKPHWVQTGQVMTYFDGKATVQRKSFSTKAEIADNDQYVVQCEENGYIPDEMCYYTCTDGKLDTSTYCRTDPNDICVPVREASFAKQCPLDFDSDEPFYNGKSLKAWWGEVIDKYYGQRYEIFSRESDIPFYVGHGSALLAGVGLVGQHFIVPSADKDFNADAVELTGWIPREGDAHLGPDTLFNSTTDDSGSGYVQDLVTEDLVRGPFNLKSITGPVKNFDPVLTMTALLRNYDPCDDSKYLGFDPECFVYHPGGYHLGNGEMIMYRSPMSNGNIDLLGHCTGSETFPPTVLIPALMANMPNLEDTVKQAGGLTDLHPASWTMHLCIDEDDIYHPYLCTEANLPSMANADYVKVDPIPFMPIPTDMRKKLCADRQDAGPDLCAPQLDTTYPYPWTQLL